MKKVLCMVALAAFSLTTVFAYAETPVVKTAAVDTVKRVKPKKVKVKKHKTKIKDSSSTMKMK